MAQYNLWQLIVISYSLFEMLMVQTPINRVVATINK